ncbi:MAG: hypothetical protein PHW95_05020 [Patescibacteria group bacterium]|nr:hypothetical protein [Patescibacteria group bacterium]
MPSKTNAPIRPATSDPSMSMGVKKGGSSWLRGLITLVIVLVIVGGGLYLLVGYAGIGTDLLGGQYRLKANWQAVFLTNGQVYFGKVEKIDQHNVYLNDIYYLQVVNQPLQQSQSGDQAPIVDTTKAENQQTLTLVKLGNELHGPVDMMIINRDQVVLMEDLKDDSRVVQAINDYLKGKK